ncbi:MAG: amidohydrolase family protein [Bacteroidota bacterium]
MRQIAAEYIYTPEKWLSDHVLELTPEGRIHDLRPIEPQESFEKLPGYLFPGFVNAHCHLELSHLQGTIHPQSGMGAFVEQVVKQRATYSEEEQKAAMEKAIEDAWESGTQAIGDIVNQRLTAPTKSAWKDRMQFHTFIELLGLDGSKARSIIWDGMKLGLSHFDTPWSLTLHAPYSVSPELKAQLFPSIGGKEARISIHMLESQAERELFLKGTGSIKEFYERMNIPYKGFPLQDPLAYILADFPSDIPSIWVHLKEATDEHLKQLQALEGDTWFCLCPRSNVYIHGEGPDVSKFPVEKVCLGTDSLASNHSLNLWEEVQWIQAHHPEIPFHMLITWATYQGGQALGLEGIGHFAQEHKPGVIYWEGGEKMPKRLV